jgi:homoserine kinase
MRLTARVPATSANLGPGFDCFGLALDLCNEVTIDTDAGPGVSWEGEGADELPTDGTDLVSRAMRIVADGDREGFSPFRLRGVNRIPLERGLGSSAAAVVAGVALARSWRRIPDPVDRRELIFDEASRIEGHPDNAAPASFGALTVIAEGRVHRFDVPASIAPVVLIPGERLSTDAARSALPNQIARADAVYNVAHGALAVRAFTTGDLDLLHTSLRDRMHQDVRLAMVPPVRDVFEELDRVVPVCLSGAGPALIAFPAAGDGILDPGEGWRVLRVAVRPTGVEIVEG